LIPFIYNNVSAGVIVTVVVGEVVSIPAIFTSELVKIVFLSPFLYTTAFTTLSFTLITNLFSTRLLIFWLYYLQRKRMILSSLSVFYFDLDLL